MAATVSNPCCNPCPHEQKSEPAQAEPPPEPAPDAQPQAGEANQGDSGAACYLPQPEDAIPSIHQNTMGPIGPWATGRVDWSPLAGLTGTRPVVDKYSIARYSEGEWRKHNKDVLDMSTREQHKMALLDWNGRQCLEQSSAGIDKAQEDNTRKLREKEQELHRWKCEIEAEIEAISEEITLTEEQRRRLKQASRVLQLPESIAGECLERRTGRLDSELVRDEVEVELIKELALTAEIRETFTRTLKDIEAQLVEDKTAKQRLESDWSDKTVSHEIEALNIALTNTSNTMLFKPGSLIFPENMSTPEYWTHFTEETLTEARATRQRSEGFRATLDSILVNASKDLRTQADRVEAALARRVGCVEEILQKLESELLKVLQDLANAEKLVIDLRAAIRRLDFPMKKAHTRLDNRLGRPRVENCRDGPHMGIIEEVKFITEKLAALQAQLRQSEDSQAGLIKARNDLEREIMLKRKSLEIDGGRTQLIRSHYPSAAALSGN